MLPFGIALAAAAIALDRQPQGPAIAAVSLVLGSVAVVTFRHVGMWAVAALAAGVAFRAHLSWRQLVTFAAVLATVAAGHGAVWNGNILAAAAAHTPTRDELLMRADVWLYRMLGLAAGYDGVFPLVRTPAAFHVLEAGYLSVFPVLVTVLVYLTIHEPRRLRGALAGLYVAYAMALLVFIAFPTAGPCIIYPTSLSAAFRETETGVLMTSMAQSFQAVRAGGTPNVAYLVAFPSLHVVVGLYPPLLVRRSRALLCLLGPSSALIVLSIFMLGYHYAVDAVAALPVVWLALRVAERYSAPEATVPTAVGS